MRRSPLFFCFFTLLLTHGPTTAAGKEETQTAEGTQAVLQVEKRMLIDGELAHCPVERGFYELNVDGTLSWCDWITPDKRADF